MDKAVENALARRTEIRRELEEIERFLGLYDRFKSLGSAQPTLGIMTATTAIADAAQSSIYASNAAQSWPRPAPKQEHIESSAPQKPTKSLSREELRPHIEAIIREAGRPLTRGNLLRKLDQRGTPVGGEADRAKNMGTIMWRLKEHFVNLPGYGYWLKNEPYPPLKYLPESGNEKLEDSE